MILFCMVTDVSFAQENRADSVMKNKAPIPSDQVAIEGIEIFGNKRTKDYIILRELPFKKGDVVDSSHILFLMDNAQKNVYNTSLFAEVGIIPQKLNEHAYNVIIVVKERWYILPFPYFELADRSFNDWAKNHNADFSRISYGLNFTYFNFTGQRDPLSLILVNGFTKNVTLKYTTPFIDKKLTQNFTFSGSYGQSREVAFMTDTLNKLVYYDAAQLVQREWQASAAFSIRKKIKKKETLTLRFRSVHVLDSIVNFYNPHYFNHASNTLNFPELEYKMEYNNVDNVQFPLKGYSYSLAAKKTGLGLTGNVNTFSITPAYHVYWPLGKQWFSSLRLKGEVKFPFDVSYFTSQALGYGGNYLRGYEYFVIDGYAFAFTKLDLKRKLFQVEMPFLPKSKNFNKIPFTLFGKVYADGGFSLSKYDSQMNNRMLYGGGVGLEILSLYDVKLSIEYSLNHLGQKGIFLHD